MTPGASVPPVYGDQLPAALDSLRRTLATHSRDWAAHRGDAWLWGLLVGWDAASLVELQARFGWSDDTVATMRVYRAAIERAAAGGAP